MTAPAATEPDTLPETDAIEATRTFTIWEGNLDTARTTVAKINRRAARYGLTGYELQVGPREERPIIALDEYGNPTGVVIGYRGFHQVTVAGDMPRIAGWSFVATLDLAEESGPITRVVPGVEIDLSAHRPRAGECDECGKHRTRTETFVVRHDDGRTKQVGRNCLQPYMGLNANAVAWLAGDPFADLAAMDREEREPSGPRVPDVYDVAHILTVTMACEQLDGWRSRSAASEYGKPATADRVLAYLDPWSDRDKEWAKRLRADADWAAAETKATKVRTWAQEQDGAGEWATNLRQLTGGQSVTRRNVALLASAVAGYNRAEGERVQREQRTPAVHVGTVGKREEFTGTVEHTYVVAGFYGDRELVKVRTDAGVLTWWASRVTGLEVGDQVTGKATVKAHETYRGEAQTVVQRATFEKVTAG